MTRRDCRLETIAQSEIVNEKNRLILCHLPASPCGHAGATKELGVKGPELMRKTIHQNVAYA